MSRFPFTRTLIAVPVNTASHFVDSPLIFLMWSLFTYFGSKLVNTVVDHKMTYLDDGVSIHSVLAGLSHLASSLIVVPAVLFLASSLTMIGTIYLCSSYDMRRTASSLVRYKNLIFSSFLSILLVCLPGAILNYLVNVYLHFLEPSNVATEVEGTLAIVKLATFLVANFIVATIAVISAGFSLALLFAPVPNRVMSIGESLCVLLGDNPLHVIAIACIVSIPFTLICGATSEPLLIGGLLTAHCLSCGLFARAKIART